MRWQREKNKKAEEEFFNERIESEKFRTNNYSSFKKLKGNRSLQKESDINNLVESLRNFGWIGPAVEVNENMEVIDGQNRIEACKRLGIPVIYEIKEGQGIKECIALNTNKKNWAIDDYVHSYAEQDNKDYIWILDTCKTYPLFKASVVMALTVGNGYTTDLKAPDKRVIQDGGVSLNDKRKKLVIGTLDYLSKFSDASMCLSGRKFMFYNALIWYRDCVECDIKHLIDSVNRYAHNKDIFASANTTQEFVYSIQDAYNYHLKGDKKIHVKDEYDKWEAHKSTK